jgi:hypothetical protein
MNFAESTVEEAALWDALPRDRSGLSGEVRVKEAESSI